MKRLTRTGFVAWLRSKKPGARVGNNETKLRPARCPLDRYMGTDEWMNLLNAPDWALNFTGAVDRQPYSWGRVTAKRALELLGEKP